MVVIYTVLAVAWALAVICSLVGAFILMDFTGFYLIVLAGVFVCAGLALKGRAR